jgi:CRP/FNR family transcriptional regulator, cyclic AMP receptor protein
MELVSRMLDGSLPYHVKGADREAPPPGPPVGRDQKVERLQQVPLFEGCSRRQLNAVAKITAVGEAAAGQILTRVGEPGNEFFLILDGTARVDISPQKHRRLGPGDFFGEMSLLDGQPRSATVVTETPLRFLVITRKNFARLLNEVPGLTQALLTTLSRRVRQAEQSIQT